MGLTLPEGAAVGGFDLKPTFFFCLSFKTLLRVSIWWTPSLLLVPLSYPPSLSSSERWLGFFEGLTIGLRTLGYGAATKESEFDTIITYGLYTLLILKFEVLGFLRKDSRARLSLGNLDFFVIRLNVLTSNDLIIWITINLCQNLIQFTSWLCFFWQFIGSQTPAFRVERPPLVAHQTHLPKSVS